MKREESTPIFTKEKNVLVFWEETSPYLFQGETLFGKILFVRVETPGDKSNVVYEVERIYPEGHPNPVHGKIKKNLPIIERFGEYIAMYKKSIENAEALVIDGTPIESWAFIDLQRAALLKHHGIYTVEALENIPDSIGQNLGTGWRDLITRAKTFCAQKKDSAHALRLEEEKKQLEGRFAALQEQINELGEALNELPAEAKAQVQQTLQKRRGRPPKVAA